MGVFSHLKSNLKNKIESQVQQHQTQINQQSPSYLTQTNDQPPPIPSRDYQSSVLTQSQQQQQQRQYKLETQMAGLSFHDDLFKDPISRNKPVSQIQETSVHPVPLPSFYDGGNKPIQTNNFYGNFLVGEQNLPVWTHPYSIWKSLDDNFKGLGVSHTNNAQKVFGDDPTSNPVKYFFNPVGICSLLLGAYEFQNGYSFKVGECERFSCGLRFETNNGGKMDVKAVQGMGFITAVYSGNIKPKISSKVGFQSFDKCETLGNGLTKYVATLFDQTKWALYSTGVFTLQDANNINMSSPAGNQTIVQLAKLSGNDMDQYNFAAGCYVTGMTLSAKCDGVNATYCFNYQLSGSSHSNKTIQWALPHQYQAFDSCMQTQHQNQTMLDSTCKGEMYAYLTDQFVMNEKLPPEDIKFDPWTEVKGFTGYSQTALNKIREVANTEVGSFDIVNASNTDSMYTAGKILDKGAYMLYVVANVLNDENSAKPILEKMKQAFDRFITNTQQSPLKYETNWKGIVSSSGLQDGNFYCDFGNCFYNDHHFHYGYHIHAAALVCLIDSKIGDGSFYNRCKDWVESLIRDIANPSTQDPYFPVFRSFDFWNGHSFANGLFAHGDGKDEESSSEDYHAYYGIKLWGMVSKNDRLNKLGSLILSIEKRAMNMYMLYTSDNTIVPQNFKANKVSGILFENKVDHATYFGMNKEYIHGIHMLPITPMSSFIRSSKFVNEEWNDVKLNALVGSIDDGWKGILMLNLALADPKTSWNFFSDGNFDNKWLDNGMSRTWSLAFSAGVGGCP